MQQTIWLAVGGLALIFTLVTLYGSTVDDTLAIVTGTLSFFTWGVWTYGSLNVQQLTRCCVYSWSSPAVTLLGLMFALFSLWFVLVGGPELFASYRDTAAEDV